MIAARLAAQRLSPPRAAGVLEATRHLLAVQAQDARGARLALRVRTLTSGRVRLELFGPQPRATREALEREAAAVEAHLSPRTAAPPSPAASSAR